MKEKEIPSYYGILPATVRYDKALKPIVRIMYAEISALSNKYGYCMASNKYFADLYEVDPATISRYISDLKNNGYIRVEIDQDKGNQRRIYIQDLFTKKSRPIDRIIKTPIDQTIKTPIDQTIKHNNTSINNTSINSENAMQLKYVKAAKETIKYLNDNPSQLQMMLHNSMFKNTWDWQGLIRDFFERKCDNNQILNNPTKYLGWIQRDMRGGKSREQYGHPKQQNSITPRLNGAPVAERDAANDEAIMKVIEKYKSKKHG